MTVALFAAAALGSAPLPDAVVRSTCAIDDGFGFADVDADGTDDLLLQVDDTVYAWPSSGAQPWVWQLPLGAEYYVPGEQPWFDVGWGAGPAQLLWGYGESVEYRVDSGSGSLEFVQSWDRIAAGGHGFRGDVDGDTLADLHLPKQPGVGGPPYTPLFLSSTGEEQMFFEDGGMLVWDLGALGDVNSDGFDDVLFARRELVFNEQTETYCSLRRGPAELMLGSPAGLVEEPLWEMYALGYPNTGVGRLVARIPGTDTLIVTIVEESVLCGDWAPGYLGVVRDAGTAEAELVQVVPVDQVFAGLQMPLLIGVWDGWVALGEPGRVQWFRWDSALGLLAEAPEMWEPGDRSFLIGQRWIGMPLGRQHEAMVYGSYLLDTNSFELLVWGRTAETVGPPEEGWSHGECLFWSSPYVPPAPHEPPDVLANPGELEPVEGPDGAERPPVPPDPARCGCSATHGPAGLMLAGLLVFATRRSRWSRLPH